MKIFGKEFKTRKQLIKELEELRKIPRSRLLDVETIADATKKSVHTVRGYSRLPEFEDVDEKVIKHNIAVNLAIDLEPFISFTRDSIHDDTGIHPILIGELSVVNSNNKED